MTAFIVFRFFPRALVISHKINSDLHRKWKHDTESGILKAKNTHSLTTAAPDQRGP